MPAATLMRAAPTVPGSTPGGSCADRKNHCYKERGYNDKFWINDLKSDINQERDSSADDPRADHQSYSDQDHDSRKKPLPAYLQFHFPHPSRYTPERDIKQW